MTEMLDICDEHGNVIGTKARADVHRDGDWHRTVHIWVVRKMPEGKEILLQRRAESKDTCPGMFDVAVGGHLSAGETLADALREADEEIGVTLTPYDVVDLGTERLDRGRHGDIYDRELCRVLAAFDNRPLSEYRPDPGELDSVVSVGWDEFLDLVAGRAQIVAGVAFDGSRTYPEKIRRDTVVMHQYMPQLGALLGSAAIWH